MSASTLLRAAREHSGVGQVALARRGGASQAEVSLIETGRRNPSVDTLDRLLRRLDHQLVAVPTVGLSGVQAAARIANELGDHRTNEAFRAFLTYSDSLAGADPTARVVLTAAAPASTRSALWDAALAAVSEYWLDDGDLPKPRWLSETSRVLEKPTPLQDDPYVPAPDPERVPVQFRARNVLLEDSTLASV